MTLAQAFRDQSEACIRLDSPFMGQLLRLLADNFPDNSKLATKLDAFTGDIGPAGHSLPLRLAGGLHALVLSGLAPDLAANYPPIHVSDASLLAVVLEALRHHEEFLLHWLDSPPQTNEIRRSAALMAMAAVAHQHFPMPIVLSELGASGGLNLIWDHYATALPENQVLGGHVPVLTLRPDWSGPLPPLKLPRVTTRAGVDLNPLNPQFTEDLLRLTAFLWPDQPERLSLTRTAAPHVTVPIIKGDAIDWLATRLATPTPGHLHLIQHTVAWQYFPKSAQTYGTALIEEAGARARPEAPLGWMSMESDGDATGKIGAALTLRLWPGDLRISLGRADFHGRWINWTYSG